MCAPAFCERLRLKCLPTVCSVQLDPQKPDEIYDNWQEVVEITTNQRRLVPRFVLDAVGPNKLLGAKFGDGHWE